MLSKAGEYWNKCTEDERAEARAQLPNLCRLLDEEISLYNQDDSPEALARKAVAETKTTMEAIKFYRELMQDHHRIRPGLVEARDAIYEAEGRR